MTSLETLTQLLGEHPSSPRLVSILEQAALAANVPLPEPEVKAYPDAVYFNYYALGISLVFIQSAHATATDEEEKAKAGGSYEKHVLDAIDIYNSRPTGDLKLKERKSYHVTFPLLPLQVDRDANLQLTDESKGEDIVRALGEPERKGGGGGRAGGGGVSIWCEWTRRGIMVEFGGDAARGPHAWERGKDAVWQVFTLFASSEAAS